MDVKKNCYKMVIDIPLWYAVGLADKRSKKDL